MLYCEFTCTDDELQEELNGKWAVWQSFEVFVMYA